MEDLETNDPRTLRDGRYTLLGIIGEGSMGRTYLAEDAESGRVAIKALYPSRLATLKDLELFHREAETLQKLSHPRIPSYVDAFDQGEGEAVRYYLVQEYVEGDTLRARINAGSRWDEQEAAEFMRRLLAILDYMHGQDPVVVHRDIKPDNVILRAADEMPALVDFGAVREVVRLTMGGGSTIIGTYGYMPPEQLMGRALPASDLYSVGVTVLEMLTRQTPQDLHGVDVQRLIASANVSEAFRRILGRLCAPSLADRYGSAPDVLADLESVTGGSALVHASRIETDIAKREEQRERALKRSSTPNFVHLGYLFLMGALILAAASGVVTLVYALATGFEAAFLLAGGVSGGALFVALLMLGTRYTHDAWEPPNDKWTRTRGELTQVKKRHFVNEYGHIDESRWYGYSVHYEFPTRAGATHEATINIDKTANLDRYEVGAGFDVYFHSGRPEWHEIQDFVHDPDDAMGRLFDPAVKHTPE